MRTIRNAAFLSLTLAAIATIGTTLAIAQPTDGPTTAPTTAPAETTLTEQEVVTTQTGTQGSSEASRTTGTRRRAARLVQPWSRVTDLTEEQRQQIIAIHVETVDKINALQAEERERCMAILTEEQRVAMQEATDRAEAERKARNAQNGQQQQQQEQTQQEQPAGN